MIHASTNGSPTSQGAMRRAETVPPQPSTPTARARLKSATDPVHKRLDADLSGFDLSDVAQYGRFLLVQARALPPIEDALAAADDRSGFDVSSFGRAPARRSEALFADLEGLSVAPPAPLSIEPFGGAEAWGVAYVLEGSRLGGRVLARRAVEGGHDRVASNMRFLAATPSVSWRGFLERMEEALATVQDVERATVGARMAFDAFAQGLELVRDGPERRATKRETAA